MKVKICLERKLVMDLSREQQGEASFLTQFDGIGLEGVEPECPFCEELLERGQCSCKEFKTAFAKLLKSYPEQNLRLVVNDNVRTVSTFPLLKDKLTITQVPLTDELILLFDNGTIARGSRETYFVSEGVVEGTNLKFYIRQKRKTEVYECQVKDLDDIPQEAKVSLCKYNVSRSKEKITLTEVHPSGDCRGNVGILRQELMPGPSLSQSTGKRKISAPHARIQKETIAEFGYGAFLSRLQELMKDK